MYATAHFLNTYAIARRDPSVKARKVIKKIRRSFTRRKFVNRLRTRA